MTIMAVIVIALTLTVDAFSGSPFRDFTGLWAMATIGSGALADLVKSIDAKAEGLARGGTPLLHSLFVIVCIFCQVVGIMAVALVIAANL